MDLNRNHYLIIGVVLALLGLQLRSVDSYVLTERATRFLNEDLPSLDARTAQAGRVFPLRSGTSRKVVRPPDWLGYACVSIGSVLILYSLAMRKPEGG